MAAAPYNRVPVSLNHERDSSHPWVPTDCEQLNTVKDTDRVNNLSLYGGPLARAVWAILAKSRIIHRTNIRTEQTTGTSHEMCARGFVVDRQSRGGGCVCCNKLPWTELYSGSGAGATQGLIPCMRIGRAKAGTRVLCVLCRVGCDDFRLAGLQLTCGPWIFLLMATASLNSKPPLQRRSLQRSVHARSHE